MQALSLLNSLTLHKQMTHADYQSLKLILKQDLQQLLNTRRPYLPAAQNFSLADYGLPDLSQFNPNAERDCEALRQAIQATIHQFEPRLQDVSVSLLETEDNEPFKISLKITGHLAIPSQPYIEFISALNPATHQLQLEAIS